MSRYNQTIRQSSRRLDLFHIVLGLALLVMAVLAFVDPNTNMVLFPLIFLQRRPSSWFRRDI